MFLFCLKTDFRSIKREKMLRNHIVPGKCVCVSIDLQTGLCLQIKAIIVIEKDQKAPKKYMTESVFDSRQRWSSKPKVSQLQTFSVPGKSCDLDHLIPSDKHYL